MKTPSSRGQGKTRMTTEHFLKVKTMNPQSFIENLFAILVLVAVLYAVYTILGSFL